ncbi:MAG: ATP synthase F1 subunit epsilon [Oscillospiraceae bacterium]|nr:ATP synthase F1 subunit epsilon [Oscillospiraceae bacterium]
MPITFDLHIRSADRDFFEGRCAALSLRVTDGELGLLANHSPLVAAVVPGALSFRTAEGETVRVAAGGGIVRFVNNDALVLLDSVETPEEIDVHRARAAAEAAEAALKAASTPEQRSKARADLDRARNRLKITETGE